MIIIKLQHGLGNQLFQYALGKKLALLHGTELKLDISTYTQRIGYRHFGLEPFAITAPVAAPEDFRRIRVPPPTQDLLSRIRRKALRMREQGTPLNERRFITEPRPTFIPEVLQARDNAYLVGDWQSEKYFKDIAPVIRREFALKEPLQGAALRVAEQIRQSHGTPVSLHVRRGDSVSNPKSIQKFGTMPLSYYLEAARMMRQKVPDAVFFVFSDDILWAHEHLAELAPIVFASDPEIKDYEDLTLMSLCAHHILPNSTFSWWSAWLNPSPHKLVIAPKKYFQDPSMDTSDLMPPEWIRL
ncbi:MAG TPA: alpha-1,2-fucosyltransferase [Candidatus Paceibacterota bacterium]|nr:alpha-1,2-fucosyltransferase [Candidatus Paceibacterota bacterium]